MEQAFAETAFDQNSHRGEGKEISWLRQWTNALDEVATLTDAERASQAVEMRAARVIEIAQCEAVVTVLGANVDRCEHALAVAVAALAGVQDLAPPIEQKGVLRNPAVNETSCCICKIGRTGGIRHRGRD